MSNDELKTARLQVEEADKIIAKAFEMRMTAVKQIANYKKGLGLPIEDKKREKELIAKESSYIEDPEIREAFVSFLIKEMEVSKDFQQRLIEGIRISYSGVPGAYAYEAGLQVNPGAKMIARPSFEKAYQAVLDGEADLAILPIENSYAGDVGAVMDLVFSGPLYINRIFDFEIKHCLLAKPGVKIEDIKKVYSHQQALSQCDEFIKKHHFEALEYPNTAVACKDLSESMAMDAAVIGSEENASLYGLEVLEKEINSSNTNTTRFGVFSKALREVGPLEKMGEHFILVFTVKNEAGALASALNIIGSHGFNMRNIRSRPMKELMWNYYFYVEIEGNINSIDGRDLIHELGTFCDRLKVVGTYAAKVD
ncbi:MAG: chorismate mutase [Bacilli bacterium]|nr:chorismate mutase [Bacilli bacterium]